MDRNNGHWSDANTKQYFGGNGRSYQRALIELPEGCANFLAAVDKKLPEMRKVMEEYQSRCQALQALKPSPAQSTSDWERIKSNIDAIKTAAERAQSLLWWLGPAVVNATVPRTPSGLRAAQRIEAFAETASPHVEKAVGYVEVVGSIHDAMTVYADATQALNGDRRAGLAFAALSFAMTYVPVLGGFYRHDRPKAPRTDQQLARVHRRLHPAVQNRPPRLAARTGWGAAGLAMRDLHVVGRIRLTTPSSETPPQHPRHDASDQSATGRRFGSMLLKNSATNTERPTIKSGQMVV